MRIFCFFFNFFCHHFILHLETFKKIKFVKIEKNSSFGFLVFHINIFKNDIFVNFSFVFIYLLWVKNKTFMEKLFLKNSKWWKIYYQR
jgi:hypothetical protein